MNEETLSALLDGECSPAELDSLLQALERDPRLRARLSRMRLAQEVLHGTTVRAAGLGFADRVMAALPERPEGVVTPIRRAAAARWRPMVALAAAAGLGAVAMLALRPQAPVAPSVTPAAQPVAALVPAPAPVNPLGEDEQARQLRNYLIAYSQSRAQHGVAATLGYARYAAYTQDAATDPEP